MRQSISELNLFLAIGFTGGGLKVAITQQFSHFTWGTVHGSDVMTAGFLMFCIGLWFFNGYFIRSLMSNRKQKIVFILLVILSVLGIPFVLLFDCPLFIRAVVVFGPFLMGHMLHLSILGSSPNKGGLSK